MVWFGTVRYSMVYGTQLFPFPLSEVVNGTKITNRTVPLFWYPSVRVPSTAKGTKRVELNSLQNIDTCYRNYRKYELPSRKLDMNGLREALYGQFPTRRLVFTIIPIAHECSIISVLLQVRVTLCYSCMSQVHAHFGQSGNTVIKVFTCLYISIKIGVRHLC